MSYTNPRKAVDILRLNSMEAARIAAAITDSKKMFSSKRLHERVRVPLSMRVILEIHGLTSPSRFQTIPFDLSRGGIGLFHGRFEYPNTPCSVELRTEDGEGVKVEGIIRRCEMVRGRVHELGVQFREHVDIDLLLGGLSDTSVDSAGPDRAAFREAIGTVTAALSDKQLDPTAWNAEIAMLRQALNQVQEKSV